MAFLINLFGAPSSGKSTLAGELFAKLKSMDLNAELTWEFVKNWTWEMHSVGPFDQLYILGKEVHQQSRLFGKVDFIISDSPCALASFYQLYSYQDSSLIGVCKAFYERAEKLSNVKVLNFLLPCRKKYQTKGRYHSQEEAQQIDEFLRAFLKVEQYPYEVLDCPDSERIGRILERLKEVTNNFEGLRNE